MLLRVLLLLSLLQWVLQLRLRLLQLQSPLYGFQSRPLSLDMLGHLMQ